MPEVKRFEEMAADPEHQPDLLKEIYGTWSRSTRHRAVAEQPPPGFGFSDTAFRLFILMASRRIESDRFFTRDFRPEVYTPEGLAWVDSNWMQTAKCFCATSPSSNRCSPASQIRSRHGSVPGFHDRARPRRPDHAGSTGHGSRARDPSRAVTRLDAGARSLESRPRVPPPSSVAEVVARLETIVSSLSSSDGCMSRGSTWRSPKAYKKRLDGLSFGDPRFLARLDVVFADLFFVAFEAFEHEPAQAPRAWLPLFEARSRRGIVPLQFALAGMNACPQPRSPCGVGGDMS